MIRNVVVHLLNEQPVVVDLFEMPTPSDAGLVCTNMRTLDGKPPVFVDHSASTFLFPYTGIRFIEIPSGSEGAPGAQSPGDEESLPEPVADDEDLEIDEDFLRRIREA
jgi:hypothetical protein